MYWYEDEVKRLENDGLKNGFGADTIFYGSSTMRLWTSLYTDFESLKPVNLGFGGSTLAACVWFFERIMTNYHPKKLVVYAGDNDLGDGRHPEEVFIFFQQLVVKVNKQFGDIPCYFVSLKPSVSRWNMVDQFKFTNNIIETEIVKHDGNWHFIDVFKQMIDAQGRPKKEYFVSDGLHLSEKGYQLWKEVINSYIAGNG
ncbi:GDSL-like Lipase/Acylhydrolase family protein [Mucilaginibacter mallensis]|uniref:GDSL-like Lipase/Acylhydrolase family protein n=1 Tax=Mucilaginibacter mallensis TaxID=652787 RepID=A0A1H1UE85_MUCMA|nr:SGNH/GDSL hydrolase family protein [Mucilaginibacter mallensis]SDS70496.1 GDSL-like Lipase/Acylhydrolase family protein [Mucilaginibacter mallensis]